MTTVVYIPLSSLSPTLILYSLPTLSFLSKLAYETGKANTFLFFFFFFSFIKASLFFVKHEILTDESVPERPCPVVSNSAALGCNSLILEMLTQQKLS